MRLCRVCRNSIADNRLAALPNTTVCLNCSSETPVKGFMTWEHKTAPKFQVVTPRQHEWFQRYDRKRPSASLPMTAKTPNGIVHGGSGRVSRPSPPNVPTVAPEDAASMIPRARCAHKDRPQVSSSGKCLQCALDYYALRAKWAKASGQ